jgi:hypothetical protein
VGRTNGESMFGEPHEVPEWRAEWVEHMEWM